MDEYSKRAKEVIKDVKYVAIATTSKDNIPWNSPVFFAYDNKYNFYWFSWKENQHSKNIAENENVFLVVYDSAFPKDTSSDGVYVQAKAVEVSNEREIEKALVLIDKRLKRKPHILSEFLGSMPRRVYKAAPGNVWMNVHGEEDGNYVDKRVEIKLR